MWDPALIGYDFGRGHPLAPVRVDLTMRLARVFGILDRSGVSLQAAPGAQEKTLRLLHEAPYLAAVRRAGDDPLQTDLYRGLGTGDNPTFHGMYEASALVAGQSGGFRRFEAVWARRGQARDRHRGGLHRRPGRALPAASCVFNDVALGIAMLLEPRAERVAYVDVDERPRLTACRNCSSRRPAGARRSRCTSPAGPLFPGTGFPDETGGPGAPGSSVNVALPAGTGDAGWLRAFEAVVPPLLQAIFRPRRSCVTLAHLRRHRTSLAHLTMTVDGQRRSYARLHELAHEVSGGR